MNINPMQIIGMLPQIKSNPLAVLSQFGVSNIPSQQSNNPQAIIQSLMNSGRISQEQYNQAMRMAQSMGFKF